jgi:hypothetical protein
MSRDRSRCPASGPSHRDRIPAGIPGRLPARRAPDVTGQDLGSLIAEVAQQHVGAGSDSEGEVPAVVLAELQVGDPFQKLINHILGARSHFRECLSAFAALTLVSSSAQTKRIHKSRPLHSKLARARYAERARGSQIQTLVRPAWIDTGAKPMNRLTSGVLPDPAVAPRPHPAR